MHLSATKLNSRTISSSVEFSLSLLARGIKIRFDVRTPYNVVKRAIEIALPMFTGFTSWGNTFMSPIIVPARRLNSNDEESSHWLISFADLMTILLVFSFVLFMVNMKGVNNESTNTEKTSTSLVTTAHADSNKLIDKTPVYIDTDPKDQSEPVTMERTILKKHFNFPSKTSGLRNNHIIDLKKIANY